MSQLSRLQCKRQCKDKDKDRCKDKHKLLILCKKNIQFHTVESVLTLTQNISQGETFTLDCHINNRGEINTKKPFLVVINFVFLNFTTSLSLLGSLISTQVGNRFKLALRLASSIFLRLFLNICKKKYLSATDDTILWKHGSQVLQADHVR